MRGTLLALACRYAQRNLNQGVHFSHTSVSLMEHKVPKTRHRTQNTVVNITLRFERLRRLNPSSSQQRCRSNYAVSFEECAQNVALQQNLSQIRILCHQISTVPNSVVTAHLHEFK